MGTARSSGISFGNWKPYDGVGSLTSFRDRILGCIVGGAIGDAFGGAYEGLAAPVDVNAESFDHWRLSDDTQLTLATCEGIIRRGRVDAEAIASSFVEWFRARRITGLGASTLKALNDLAIGAHWALSGRRGEMGAGNGAAMRIAPLAFFCEPGRSEARKLISDICRITHHNDEAYVGALAVVIAIRSSWNRHQLKENSLLDYVCAHLPGTAVRDRIRDIATLDQQLTIADVASKYGNSGYVVESIPLALYGSQLVNQIGFEGMIIQLISAGGDTDTIASIAGQVAGAWIGYKALPLNLVAGLPDSSLVTRTASEFADVAEPFCRIWDK